MAYSINSKDYFKTVTYTGDESGQTITVGFQPDFTWIKTRDGAYNHQLVDAIRGNTKYLKSNATDAENTSTNAVTGFVSSGFTLGADTNAWVNQNGKNIVSWNWKANGAGSSNSDGSTTATVSVNTTAGFSMVYYNTGGSGTQSMGHGLGSAPELIITKPTQNTESWYVYSKTLTHSNILKLNATDASSSSGVYAYAPTDSVFSVSNSAIGGYNGVMSYCFKSIKGFSAMGSYTGNGNADGSFQYLGFKPAFILLKQTSSAGNDWWMFDNKRLGFNPSNSLLRASISNAELANTDIDLVSNGFKIVSTDGGINASGSTYIYMAFAEEPLVSSNGVPATAR